MKQKYIDQWENLYSEQVGVRIDKRSKLQEQNSHPYKHGVKPSVKADALFEKYDHLAKEEIGQTDTYSVAGRALLVRDFGKAAFIKIDDGSRKFQVYVKKNVTNEEGFADYKLCDYGDIIWAKGDIFKTNKGELTLNALEFKVVTKSIRPLPEKFHGLTDQESRYRMRYVDMIMNTESRDKLKKRSEIVRYIREFFYKDNWLEVETPMMHSIAGGATAKPFNTHHNALDMELFMRIAPELHLKRLIVGGYDKVFEMNRCFRNEGLSLKHNPEFTSIEFYQAYATYEDLMDLTEKLIHGLAKDVMGSSVIKWGDRQIDFGSKFERLPMKDAVVKYTDLTLEDLTNKDKMISLLKSKNELEVKKDDLDKFSAAKLMVLCFEEFVEDKLINPTFITEYPTEVSPLSRRNDENPDVVDRFELFINGWEIANAFNELNDPTDQLSRFADQAMLKEGGDDEACDPDYDYVRALEYGMPPTAGEGIGIDRLVMLLTDSQTIKDVILFPLLKKETFFRSESNEGEE
ncbi:MAG: lysine--tRNA ligase [Bacteriovoracaceae bacterium]|jgi:lysyl-tRNA synthetase class 2|nr:lysine--tRNA ligase [Bacteriovoracaceae bacterium]